MNKPIPVILLSGFLGSGKTTLLNYILKNKQSLKIAIIENEFSNTTIDQQLINHYSSIHITNLKNGCICCSSKVELTQTLYELLDYKKKHHLTFDYLFIECSGMADPAPILQLLLTNDFFSENFSLKGTITLIDALHVSYHLKHFNVIQAQIALSDFILINKVDLLQESEKDLIKQIQTINISAPIYSIQYGQFDLNLLEKIDSFNLKSLQKRSLLACTPILETNKIFDINVNSFVIHHEKAYDAEKLTNLMNKILTTFPRQLIRYKGIIYIKNNPNRLIIQGIQQIYNSEWGDPWKNNTPYSELIFIGVRLPEKEFRYFFNQILG